MIDRGPATEVDMVLAFLRAEAGSSRFEEHIAAGLNQLGLTRRLIDEPDPGNRAENVARKRLLAFRGYEQRVALFTGFPADAVWRNVTLETCDFARLQYANYKTWVELSDGTRLVVTGARNFQQHPDHPESYQIHGIAAALRAGHTFPPLIAVEGIDGSLVLLEGHSRATAYVLEERMAGVEALIGSSSTMHLWVFY